jgi:hypothetical protein
MDSKRWRLNLPWRDYRFEIEDIVPAIAGCIGAVVIYTAIVAAYAASFNLPREFVVENVRLEMVLVSILFVIPISGFFNPRANLPGAHGPMIPLIGMIAVAGGHPLALALLMCVFGLALGLSKSGSRLIQLTGPGVRGGLLMVLGMLGLMTQLQGLRAWATRVEDELIFRDWAIRIGPEFLFFVIVIVSILVYTVLARFRKRWVAIPLCSLIAFVIAYSMGANFQFVTSPGVPSLDPSYWWGTDTGWKLGLPNLEHFIAVLPFAVLAIAMWPPDFLGHKVFQEMNYPKGSEKVQMDVDDTMVVCSVRQAVVTTLGGGNVTSSWGTYLIPAGIAKRPIAAGAVLTGLLCIAVALLGFPMDVLKWEPVLRVALVVGLFLPLIEAGLEAIQTRTEAESAGLCVIASLFVNPVFGWALAMFADNAGLISRERAKKLPLTDRLIIPLIVLIVLTGIMAVVGLIPGIPSML